MKRVTPGHHLKNTVMHLCTACWQPEIDPSLATTASHGIQSWWTFSLFLGVKCLKVKLTACERIWSLAVYEKRSSL